VRSNPLEPVDGGVRPAPPDRIAIPAAHVDTVVDSVGTGRDNAIEVPPIGRAGWYGGGPRPGERGRAVIIGHLDTNRGPGLFARVPALEQGDPIDVTDRRGDVFHYRVTTRAEVRKDSFPTAEVYGGDRDRVLVLVTCGGPFDPASGYRDNIVVFARAA
jgi:sortase (surface protein transpeptidase)